MRRRPRRSRTVDYNNVAPRVGLAWQAARKRWYAAVSASSTGATKTWVSPAGYLTTRR